MNAIVKNSAPPKQGDKKGLDAPETQPAVQADLYFKNSIIKLVQANKVPANKTTN